METSFEPVATIQNMQTEANVQDIPQPCVTFSRGKGHEFDEMALTETNVPGGIGNFVDGDYTNQTLLPNTNQTRDDVPMPYKFPSNRDVANSRSEAASDVLKYIWCGVLIGMLFVIITGGILWAPNKFGTGNSGCNRASIFVKKRHRDTNVTHSPLIVGNLDLRNTNAKQDCVVVAANGSIQLYENLKDIPYNIPVCLHLIFFSFSNWETNNMIILAVWKVQAITFSGSLDMQVVRKVLDLHTSVQKINWVNTNITLSNCLDVKKNLKFSQNQNLVNKTKTVLSKLHSVSFENFGKCATPYDFLLTFFIMREIRTIEVTSITIEEANIQSIQKLLHTARFTARVLSFANTSWGIPIFQTFNFAMFKLEELRVDILTSVKSSLAVFGKDLKRIFPNLKRLVSKVGFLGWIDIRAIFGLSKIEVLEMGVSGSVFGTSLLNVANKSLPSLKNMTLLLELPKNATCTTEVIDGYSVFMSKSNYCKVMYSKS